MKTGSKRPAEFDSADEDIFREDRQPGSGNESTSAVSLQFSNGSSNSPLIDWDSLYGSNGDVLGGTLSTDGMDWLRAGQAPGTRMDLLEGMMAMPSTANPLEPYTGAEWNPGWWPS